MHQSSQVLEGRGIADQREILTSWLSEDAGRMTGSQPPSLSGEIRGDGKPEGASGGNQVKKASSVLISKN